MEFEALKIVKKDLLIQRKGGSKVWVLGQGGDCNSATNGPNDLKSLMQGAFMG